ncbi:MULTISPECIES: hypothetical protein [Photorhabdus]|nr:hypothetical protein [Photorhabdus thracensis]MCC8422577.1 hypothetical protein [Photorhabdus thracensis]
MNKVNIVAETLAELREHYCLMGISGKDGIVGATGAMGSVYINDKKQ